MDSSKTTEASSAYEDLEQMSIAALLENINHEDGTVAAIVKQALPAIESLVTEALKRLRSGDRLFYVGAGTSGRLGVLDAAEIPPTYGTTDKIIAVIAGGNAAIKFPVEFAEDNEEQGWKDLQAHHPTSNDFVIGISASGNTPYVLGALRDAKTNGLTTGCIICNETGAIAEVCEYPILLPTGPEFVTGSTRMKAGTAQKMVLNMISTTLMIRLGKVKGNKMINMQLSNNKLINRAAHIVASELNVSTETAIELLKQHHNIPAAISKYQPGERHINGKP